MSPIKINTYEQYCQLTEHYSRKGRFTNDYLQNEAADLIFHDRLFAVYGQDNALLLVQKDGFFRLYYYINNTDERLELPNGELVTEILFRGENIPEAEVKWLEGMGFKKNLVRDQYFAKYSSFTQPVGNENVIIGFARNVEEVRWAVDLFNSTFDKWSGDYVSPAMSEQLFVGQQVLMAKDVNGRLCGTLHLKKRQGVCWLNHVAVVPESRGKNIGRSLMEAYIEQGHQDDNSRYMLWVQRQNVAAVTMYKNKGFQPMNKSTLSMIKI